MTQFVFPHLSELYPSLAEQIVVPSLKPCQQYRITRGPALFQILIFMAVHFAMWIRISLPKGCFPNPSGPSDPAEDAPRMWSATRRSCKTCSHDRGRVSQRSGVIYCHVQPLPCLFWGSLCRKLTVHQLAAR